VAPVLLGPRWSDRSKDSRLSTTPGTVSAHLDDVSVLRDGRALLNHVHWSIADTQRWVVLGPNGSGKTTLLRVASGRLIPSDGTVRLLGQTIGRTDLRALRSKIALVSAAVTRQLATGLLAKEVVVTGADGALAPWWHEYTPDQWTDAEALLDQLGVGGTTGLAERPFEVISEGERQQVLLARALMGRPDLLFLDEPAAGLDLGARERLLQRLTRLANDPEVPPFALVTHHAEEIPVGATHAALLRNGELIAAGPIGEVVTSSAVSSCFSADVRVHHRDGRWWTTSDV
jgi:iron complex transport system ATP-binding protein